ncbi:hydantoinase/oxoprolinase family protein [Methanosarcina sp. KYL-1]|uniref:hydantoinase/oxoprolinase family protein n=1 Tax=Methanosarcina sp. KYL-1 TaxID=2602068 RepID=UPI002101C408|nr:hydantoinase/oxoprolinase family protein [Methanosarcina sp. KYL-1]MCQ1534417.1 hydantoinase/oxoprolinase family protein [Methanosarcina sp. KYL-1]
MHYSLGIDAGGTYTDAVIVRNRDDTVIAVSKALTTYPDPLEGIKNAIDGLDKEYIKNVKVVSVSTTLSTNTILEGTGFPVGLILVGNYDLTKELPTPHYIQVNGGHGYNGAEAAPLDLEAVKKFALEVKEKVSAFAVSSYFSIRNPEHEIAVKKAVFELTGLPVVCAHELSQDLGAFERAVTAFFNAQLIPISEKFMQTVVKEIESRGMEAKVLMLKCDGSVVGIKKALEKPIESIFSGPAGSLVGAAFLSGKDTCAMIDVGGTSTDISMIKNGVPEMSEAGAVVGGWTTRVRAIKMETSAMGGDSHVWVKEKKITIGPHRVIPLCRAASLYLGFLQQLKVNPMPSKIIMGINFQPTKFYIRTGYRPIEISKGEKEVLDAVSETPTSVSEMYTRLGKYPASYQLDSLLQKRLIQAVGFTPTDALHVLGDYTEWETEASEIGAAMLGSLVGMEKEEFARHIKKEFARNMASGLISFFLDGVDKTEVRKIFDLESPAKFKVEVPVVLIGGPVVAYQEELKNILDAEIVVPKHAEAGNAAGALAAKGVRRAEILIRPVSMAAPDLEFFVFSERGRERFGHYGEALDHAHSLGEKLIMDYMADSGLDPGKIRIEIDKREIVPDGWKNPMETKLVFLGTGNYASA